MSAPAWSVSGGDYVPAGFVPRGPVWPSNRILHMLLTVSLIDLIFPLKCEVFTGTVSHLERKNLPKSWLKRHGSGVGTSVAGAQTRHALIWLAEHGETMIGYAFTQRLLETRVGDQVTIWVKPNSGSVRRLRNHTRPRKWWQF